MTDSDEQPYVYLSGPIEGAEDYGRAWRERVKAHWGTRLELVDPLDHVDPAEDDRPEPRDLVLMDRALIRDSDGVLIRYDDQPTWGTPMEAYIASQEYDIPVALAWLADRPVSPWATAHADVVRSSVDETLQVLRDMIVNDRAGASSHLNASGEVDRNG